MPTPGAEEAALGLLGDLLGHEERELVAETGLALQRGRLGTWLVGEEGALMVRPGGRRVDCWCVRVSESGDLPAGDRVAHLLLALREDEEGFATVANFNFSGAPWRVRLRLPKRPRPALERARVATDSRLVLRGADLLDLRLELLHHRRVAEGGDVAHLAALGDVAEQAAHDLAGAGLREVAGPDDPLRPGDLRDPRRRRGRGSPAAISSEPSRSPSRVTKAQIAWPVSSSDWPITAHSATFA